MGDPSASGAFSSGSWLLEESPLGGKDRDVAFPQTLSTEAFRRYPGPFQLRPGRRKLPLIRTPPGFLYGVMRLTKRQRRPRLEHKPRPHPDNLHALYRESKDPVERARWHAIWLLATGHAIPQVAQTLGYSTCWVRDTLPRHNEGQPPLLSSELQEAFRQALLQSHPQDGIWTIRNAALWLSERLGRPVDPRRAWNWRRRLGFAPLRPRHWGGTPSYARVQGRASSGFCPR